MNLLCSADDHLQLFAFGTLQLDLDIVVEIAARVMQESDTGRIGQHELTGSFGVEFG